MFKRHILLLGALLTLAAPPTLAEDKITIKGSDTMVLMSQIWAENFTKANKDIKVSVTGGGSGTGIAALMNNTADLANSSRNIKPEEKAKIEKEAGKLHEFKAALDGLAVVVNAKAAPVKELSMRQLMGIYTGQVNDWSEVGGKPGRIVRYCREANSGTYVFFQEHVLNKQDYASDCQTMPGTASVAQAVSKDPKGIGFGGVAYFAKRKTLKIIPLAGDKGKAVNPVKKGEVDFEVIWSGDYPLSRYLYVYGAGDLSPAEQKFIDFIQGGEGQKLVAEADYIPLDTSKKKKK